MRLQPSPPRVAPPLIEVQDVHPGIRALASVNAIVVNEERRTHLSAQHTLGDRQAAVGCVVVAMEDVRKQAAVVLGNPLVR